MTTWAELVTRWLPNGWIVFLPPDGWARVDAGEDVEAVAAEYERDLE